MLIDMKRITKSYKIGPETVNALQGVDLSINRGEFIAIMGRSGSGKSTLMNIIGCLDKPTQGTYRLANIDMSDMTDDEQARFRNKHIGFVFQQFNLVSRMIALKQVMMPLMYAGTKHSICQAQAEQGLKTVGLGERLYHRPEELSGGQQQRVAIARALVNGPDLILADEPTGALDTQTGWEVLGIFRRLHQEAGITIIIVTHDEHIATFAERIIKISDGLIVSG
jgi:putative ABC transport system ATP-binding protein